MSSMCAVSVYNVVFKSTKKGYSLQEDFLRNVVYVCYKCLQCRLIYIYKERAQLTRRLFEVMSSLCKADLSNVVCTSS